VSKHPGKKIGTLEVKLDRKEDPLQVGLRRRRATLRDHQRYLPCLSG